MISSSDVRWGMVNKNTIENKLKIINSKITLNTSDGKAELDNNKSFLKVGTVAAL